MRNFPERDDPHIVEIAVRIKPLELNCNQQREIGDAILSLLASYGAEFYTNERSPNGYVEFRNQYACDMDYDGG